MPHGAVAVVDRIRTPLPRTCHFRLLTALEQLEPDEHSFKFTVWGVPARIRDFSPASCTRLVAAEHTSAQVNADQRVATLRRDDVTEAIFAVVIGIGEAVGYRLTTDALGYDLLDLSGARLHRVNWPKMPDSLPVHSTR